MKKPAFAVLALLTAITSANALNAPALKEGFWSVHTVTTTNPGNKVSDGKYSICRNHAFDQHAEAAGKNMNCNIKSDSMQGNKHIVEMTCHVGPTTIVSKSVGTYQSDTSVHNETTASYAPAFMGNTLETMVMDFTYVGSCPAGVQPGDRVNQDGSVMHLWRH
jgi:predicted homoserine dehydrogenase-like protein